MEFGINDWRNAVMDTELPTSAKMVAMAIAKYWRENKLCYPSIATLMADSSLSKPSVISAIKALTEANFIRIKKGQIKYLSSLQNYYEFIGVDDGKVDSKNNGKVNGKINGKDDGKNDGKGDGKTILPEISEIREVSEFKEKDTLKGIQKEKPENKKFVKPTLAEVQAYCRERKNNVDAERWLDYYEANGWKVGKNPMKDWRAAVRTWERGTVAGGGTNTEKRDENGLREIVW